MKEDNETFKQLVQARNDERSGKESPLIGEHKIKLGQYLQKLFQVIELMTESQSYDGTKD